LSEFQEIFSFWALWEAARRAAKGKRRAGSTARFFDALEPNLRSLERELLGGHYTPSPYRTFRIHDPKPRTISAAEFRDRVVHHALCRVLEPRLEALSLPWSFACRPGRGVHAALRHARRQSQRHRYCLKMDVLHFFETIAHASLKRLLRPLRMDAQTRRLCALLIDHGAPGSEAGRGLPIGNLTSQHLANHALRPLDQLLQRGLRVGGWCRYMDDVLVFDDDKARLWEAQAQAQALLRARLGLSLRPEVTRVAPCAEGIAFLGFRVFPGLVRLDASRKRRLGRRLRALQRGLDMGAWDEEYAARRAQSLLGWVSQAQTLSLRRALLAQM
jgi:RNA-directed DNA polymerase